MPGGLASVRGWPSEGSAVVAAASVGGAGRCAERPTPRRSPSTSTGSGSTCSSPPTRSSALPRPMANSSGGTIGPPIGMGINCSTPIYQDGLVFAASAYGAGGGAVKLSKDASGAVKAEEVYFTTRMQNHHGGMIVVDGCLYGANGGNAGGLLSCLDFQTGELLWRDREAPKGSLALADGRLYLSHRKG